MAATGRSPALRPSGSSAWTDGHVETRPIKGTRGRTRRPEADLFAGDELRASDKDRAENVMIVDLLRNDLSRTCRPESVRVSQLCGLETYEYVQHLVSVVEGTLRDDCTPLDLLRTSFPGGSVTGAPKDSRDGNHRRTGADGARRVLRLARLHWLGRPNGHEYPHQNNHGGARLVAVAGGRRRSSPSRIRAKSTKKHGTRRRGCCGRCGREELNRRRMRSCEFIMILLIDNYDSFAHNLARYFERLGQPTHSGAQRRDRRRRRAAMRPAAVVLSPGPCTPREAGASLEIVRALHAEVPMLGVCLGHQVIAEASAGELSVRRRPCMARRRNITHDGSGLFSGLPSPLTVAGIIRWSSSRRRCRTTYGPRPGPTTAS